MPFDPIPREPRPEPPRKPIRVADDDALTMLVLRLFNAKFAMQRGEPGQRARFFALLTAIGARRRQLT